MAKRDSGGDMGGGTQPIIIKRVKKHAHGHHGGSWKVAYADFVTAMMAFFLLMWLLGSVDQDTKEGVASYFKRPLNGLLSQGPYQAGDHVISQSNGSPTSGALAPGGEPKQVEAARFESLMDSFQVAMQENPVFEDFKEQVRFEMVDDGVRIQVLDVVDHPMFAEGSAHLQPDALDLLREITDLINTVPNPLLISGHTDATPYAGGEAGYSNWELSVDRANAARRVLVAAGLHENKILRVEGLGSTALADPQNPRSPANRRITLVLLNAEAVQRYQREKTMR